VKGIVMDWLRSYRPDLVPRYERLYARGAYAPKAERARIAALTRPRGRATPLRRDPAPPPHAPARAAAAPARPAAAPAPQESLF
jgi:hypothetical protein